MSDSRATVVYMSKPAPADRRLQPDRRAAYRGPGPDFAFLANAIPQLVWTASPEGYCDYFNQRWFDYTGITFEESAGSGWQYVLHPEDLSRTLAAWQQANLTGQECVVEHRLRHRSGEYRWNLTKAMPMRNSDGSITRWFGTCTDIQAQKDAEGVVHEQTKKREKAKLAHKLAHEINNPLNAAMNLIYLAGSTPDDSRMYLDLAEEQLAKVAMLTAELLHQR